MGSHVDNMLTTQHVTKEKEAKNMDKPASVCRYDEVICNYMGKIKVERKFVNVIKRIIQE